MPNIVGEVILGEPNLIISAKLYPFSSSIIFLPVSIAKSLFLERAFILEEVTNAFNKGRVIIASIAIAIIISIREKPLSEHIFL